MSFFEIVLPKTTRARAIVAALAVFAGLASTFALTVINNTAQDPSMGTVGRFGVFALAVLLSIIAARVASRQMIAAVESSLHELKVRLACAVEESELQEFEQIGRAEIFDRISQNLTVISMAGSQLGPVAQSLSIFVLALGYFAWLSPLAFVALLPLLLGGLYLYRSQQLQVVGLLQSLFAGRVRFFNRLMDMIRGAKEIKLNRARGRGVAKHFASTSAELRDLSIGVSVVFTDSMLFLNFVLFVLLSVLVFLVPRNLDVDAQLIPQLVIVMLFAWGSLQSGLAGYSLYLAAEQALAQLARLETKLDGGQRGGAVSELADLDLDLDLDLGWVPPEASPPELPPPEAPPPEASSGEASAPEASSPANCEGWLDTPGALELDGVEYSYADSGDEPGFHLGPINLRVAPGELLFIVGGNGAGKSTLLKVLTGLYEPSRGTRRVGSVTVGRHNLASFRELISVIFTDVHLFSRAYGLLGTDPERVTELLRELDIAHKTAFVDDRFTNRRLSSGQRKRLAMVISMLEDRPIVILDEWAADQDPQFRAHFYEHMLPNLRRRGKTVIAVSHDDRYFHCADRVVVLDYGELRELDISSAAPK